MITSKDRFGVAALGNKALQRRSFTTPHFKYEAIFWN